MPDSRRRSPSRPRRRFRWRRALLAAVAVDVICAVGVVLAVQSQAPGNLMGTAREAYPSPVIADPDAPATRSSEDVALERLLAKHGCWRGGEDRPFPTGVVLVESGSTQPVYREGHQVVAAALDSVFGDRNAPGVDAVVAFCDDQA